MVHTEYETLGDIIKAARQKSGLTIEDLIRRLYNCDERSLEVIKATAIALIDTAPK